MSIQCIPVRCGEPPRILNGYAIGSNYSFGAMVAYSCNRGFYIKGEKKSACEATGRWGSPTPTCHPVSCAEPPKVENGFLEVRCWFTRVLAFVADRASPLRGLLGSRGVEGNPRKRGYTYTRD